jgi:hypothetical protein
MTRTAPAEAVDAILPGLVGLAAIVFSAIYVASDVIEVIQGGFSPTQLALTYAAEAAIPLFVLGLYAVQRPAIARLGLAGAVGYAYAFVFFTGTVLYTIVEPTADWDELVSRLGPWIPVHGLIMVVAGIAFGTAVARAGVLPAWTGWTLVAGMLLMAATAPLPDSPLFDAARAAAASVRTLAFAAMGASLMERTRRRVR